MQSRKLAEEVTTYCILARDIVLVPDNHNKRLRLETWKMSQSSTAGRLLSTFSLPESLRLDKSRLAIYGEVSPTASTSSTGTDEVRGLADCHMVKLEWDVEIDCAEPIESIGGDLFEDGFSNRYEIFVRTGAFLEDYGYSPYEFVPYFVWSTGNVCIQQTEPKQNILEKFINSGRHARMLSSSTVEIHDFVVPRYYVSRHDELATELVDVAKPSALSLLSLDSLGDEFRSYSLPYWKVNRNLGFDCMGVYETGVMIDEEHIVIILVG